MFANMKIQNHLSLAFALLLALLCIVAYVGWSNLVQMKKQVDVITHENIIKIESAFKMEDSVSLVARAVQLYSVSRQVNA